MQFKTSVTIRIKGEAIQVDSEFSDIDIQSLGVRGLPVIQECIDGGRLPVCVGHLVNVAGICRLNKLFVDELGALRLARRLSTDLIGELDGLIASRQPECCFVGQGIPEHVSFLHHRDDPDAFRAALSQPPIDGLTYPGLMYDAFVHGTLGFAQQDATPNFIDNLSFHVLRKGRKVATVQCWVQRDGALTWTNDTPVTIHCVDPAEASAITSYALQYLLYLVRAWGCTSLVVKEVNVDQLTIYKQLATNLHFSAELLTRPYLDLGLSPEKLQAGIRKSYKSHVNWCKENIDTEYFSGQAISQQMVSDCYVKLQGFHMENIRKFGDGMPVNLYLYFVRQCMSGLGEIAISRHQGEVCGITITVDDGQDAYYAQAGSTEVAGAKSPGAYIVLNAAERARQRGQRRYLMDRYTPASVCVDMPGVEVSTDHTMALRFFKRGFSDQMEKTYVYKVLPPRIKAKPH